MPVAAALPFIIAGSAAASAGVGIYEAAKGPPKTPPPQALFPQTQSAFMQGINQYGPQGLKSLNNLATGSSFQDVFGAIAGAQKRFTAEGEANLLEKFSSMGLRYSSPAMNAVQDFLTQSNKDLLQVLSQLGLQEKGIQLQASGQLADLFGTAGMGMYQQGFGPSAAPSLIGGGSQILSALLLSGALKGGNSATPGSSTGSTFSDIWGTVGDMQTG